MKLVVGSIVAGILVVGVVSSSAQSLADVARNEEARRKNIKAPSKVYTDADVEKFAPLTASSQAAATTVTALDGNGAPIQGGMTAEGLPTDEAGWRARMQNARDGLDRDKLLLSALEQQAMRAALRKTAGGTEAPEEGGDDVAARAAEIKRLKGQMDANRGVLANAEEDARRAGVPPGWVR